MSLTVMAYYPASAQVISTFAGNWWAGPGHTGDGGPATAAGMHFPWGITVDNMGNVYVLELNNECVRKIDPTGVITAYAGTGTIGSSGDGGPATNAQFWQPLDIVVDRFGNLYISDGYEDRVRKVAPSGIITTYAGNGVSSNTGDGGPATNASVTPNALAVDTMGNLYICTGVTLRKVDTFGIITTIAGTGTAGFTGDGGPATAANIKCWWGVDVDKHGNIYFTDHGGVVRKIDAAGTISTFAGSATTGFSGDGGPATAAQLGFNTEGVKADDFGNVYITDRSNDRIRKVDAFGTITTFIATGVGGYSGDGGPATAATIAYPGHVARYGHGNIYMADRNNNVVRMVSVNPYFLNGHLQHTTFCSGITMSIDTLLAANDSNSGVTETWSLIGGPYHGFVSAAYTATTTGGTVYPSGLVYTSVSGYTGADTFTVRITDGIISDTTTVYVNVTPTPVIGAISGTDSVCTGDSILLADTTAGGAWSASNTHASITAGMVHGLSAGTDTINYTVSNFCGITTISHVVQVSACPSSVPALQAIKTGLTISPNPNSGTFTFYLSSAANEEARVTISDLDGATVKEISTVTNTGENISMHVPGGIYLLKAYTAHGTWTARLVVTPDR